MFPRRSKPLLVGALVALVALVAVAGAPQVLAVTNAFEFVAAPPASVAPRDMAALPANPGLTSNTRIRRFLESPAFILESTLTVTAKTAGTFTTAPASPPTLAAGTSVQSQLLHAERLTGTSTTALYGWAVYSKRIVGVIATKTHLSASDGLLAQHLTDYAPASPSRGLEFSSSGDRFRLSTVGGVLRKLEVWLKPSTATGSGGPDQIRVLLAGPTCTITGSPGDDIPLDGTSADDVICGLGGKDKIRGKGGNDTLIGGTGVDSLFPGIGNDKVYGGPGIQDSIAWIDGFVYPSGPIAIDLAARTATSTQYGSDTVDSIEEAWGTPLGGDTISGDRRTNYLFGLPGADELHGREEADRLDGDDPVDFFDTDGSEVSGNDELYGDEGNDLFFGGRGEDWVDGGSDDDTVRYQWSGEDSGTEDVTIELGPVGPYAGDWFGTACPGGSARGETSGVDGAAGHGHDVLCSMENAWGGKGNDTITGSPERNQLEGGDADDILNGGDGPDLLFAGLGADILNGDEDDDLLVDDGSAAGLDTLDGGDGASDICYWIEVTAGDDTVIDCESEHPTVTGARSRQVGHDATAPLKPAAATAFPALTSGTIVLHLEYFWVGGTRKTGYQYRISKSKTSSIAGWAGDNTENPGAAPKNGICVPSIYTRLSGGNVNAIGQCQTMTSGSNWIASNRTGGLSSKFIKAANQSACLLVHHTGSYASHEVTGLAPYCRP